MGLDLNRVQLKGTISDDPQSRSKPGGDRIVTLRIATVRRYQKDGEWKEMTNWHRVVCFGARADIAGQLRQGDRVSIEGELQTRKYESDGKPQYMTEVNALDIEQLGSATATPAARPTTQRQAPTSSSGQSQYGDTDSDQDVPF